MNSQCNVSRNPSFSTLHKGDTGSSVSYLQQLLNNQGSHLSVSGKFDTLTLGAVISFQQKKGLPVTGEVDEATWCTLNQ